MFAIFFIYHQGKCPFIVGALIEQVPPNTQTHEPGGVYIFTIIYLTSVLHLVAPNQAVLDFGEIGPWGLVIGFWIGFDFGLPSGLRCYT